MGGGTDSILHKDSECQLDGNRHVPELWSDDGRRKLDLNWWNDDWNPSCRFLSVRN
jgi:hypothetical protein